MKLPVTIVVAIFSCARTQRIDECLQRDSISCIQKSFYRGARDFFDRDSFDILPGISLIKSQEDDRSSRKSKALAYEKQIDESSSFMQRQSTLESFIRDGLSDFLTGRSLKIDFVPILDRLNQSARAFSDSVPKEIQQTADAISEGRGRKKFYKNLMPLLLATKLKFGVLATFAYFTVVLLAKKALLFSIISVMISTFIGIKALWAKKNELPDPSLSRWSSGGLVGSMGWSPPAVPSSGWSPSGGESGWEDTHGAYSSHNQAYTHSYQS
ncbi:hypothetical protein QAD02_020135 [Eretmocerus hayati]|uniref:Uncharacterized protein n=1 Tax=Eretmocerus hayati TaxID=131215 RepID=A0ACC2PMT3_9HYME|nr:hypothetical protein QAD02_020135 [Eretmocerus hayati]